VDSWSIGDTERQVESAEGPVTRVPDSELEHDEELTSRWRGKLFAGVGYDDVSPSACLR
jgi:hypothetical protein